MGQISLKVWIMNYVASDRNRGTSSSHYYRLGDALGLQGHSVSNATRRLVMQALRKSCRILGAGQKSRIGRLGAGAAIGAIVAGFSTPVLAQYVAGGGSTTASGAIAIGPGSSVATLNGVAIGNNSDSTGDGAIAIGNNNVVDTFAAPNTKTDNGILDRTTGTGNLAFPVAGTTFYPAGIGIGQLNTVDAGGIALGTQNQANNTGNSTLAIGLGNLANGAYGSAIGIGNAATATSATAFGTGNTASANTAIAIGRQNTASGQTSIALGNVATANQTNAIAIGHSTKATAAGAIAIGGGNNGSSTNLDATAALASGTNAVAVGTSSEASGATSLAAGNASTASGASSVALGNAASASKTYSIAIGESAVASTADNTTAIGRNASSTGLNGIALGLNSRQSGGGIAAGNDTASTGLVATSIGYRNSAAGDLSSAIGASSTANGNRSIAFGSDTVAGIAGSATTVVKDIAIGDAAKATGSSSIAIGDAAIASAQDAVAIGHDAKATGAGAVAIGVGQTASGVGSVAIGDPSTVIGTGAVGVGAGNTSTGNGAITIGELNTANGIGTIAAGEANTAIGQGSVALGNASSTTAAGSVAIGDTAKAISTNSIAIGSGATATGVGSPSNAAVAIGTLSTATGRQALAIGSTNSATATQSTAIGNNVVVSGNSGLGIGNDDSNVGILAANTSGTSATYTSVSGVTPNATDFTATQVTGNMGLAVGQQSQATADYAAVFGWHATASGVGATALGGSSNAAGSGAIAAGAGSSAAANESAAYGNRSAASGVNSTALGTRAQAQGINSVALGALANAGTNGNGIAIGGSANASGGSATSIGGNSIASNTFAVALGDSSIASGETSIAIGRNAKASATNAISIGNGNTVSGANSGAIGDPTTITGTGSYSLGNNNNIAANNAFVVGNGVTIAAGLDGAVALGNGSTVAAAVGTSSATVGTSTFGGFAGSAPVATVSVGAAGSERTITNVAAGRVTGGSTDAINGSQLFSVATVVDVNTKSINTLGDTVESITGAGTKIAPDGSLTTAPTFNVAGSTYNNVGAALAALDSANLVKQTGGTPGSGQITVGAGTQGTSVSFANSAAVDRTLTGVAAGSTTATSVDAINGSQINTLASSIATNTGGGSKYDPVTGTVTAPTINAAGSKFANTTAAIEALNAGNDKANTGIASAIGGGMAIAADGTVTAPTLPVNGSNYSNVADALAAAGAGFNFTTGKTGTGVANGTSVSGIGAGETHTVIAGDNIITTQTGNDVAIALNPALTGITSLAVTGGPTIDGSGIKLVAGDTLDAGGNKIVNVAAGSTTATSTDAINGSQLNTGLASVAGDLGGGAKYDPTTGTVLAPNYSIAGNTYNDVGSALSALANGGASSKYFHANSTLPDSKATGTDSVAIGPNAVASNAGDIALGSGATTAAPSIGNFSVNGGTIAATAPTSVLSIGAAGSERQIQNVAAGVVSATSTDAVNGSQLFAVGTAVDTLGNTVETITGGGAVIGADGKLVTAPTMTVGGVAYHDVTTAVEAGDAKATKLGDGLATALGGGSKVAPDGTVTAPSYALGGNTYTNVGSALGALANGAIGPVQYANAATPTTSNGGTPTNNLTLVGAAAGPVTLDNVKAGSLATGSTQAVNGGQINTLGTSIASSIGGTAAFDPLTGGVSGTAITVDGTVYTDITSAVQAAGGGLKITTAATGTGVANGISVSKVGPGGTATLTAGNNIITTQTGSDVAIALNPVVNGLTSVAINGGPTISSTGITGLAAGALNATSTDAVNGAQLYATNQSITNLTNGSAGLVQQNPAAPSTGVITVGASTGGTVVDFKNSSGADRVLTGVAPGATTATSTDAVNGSQMFAGLSSVASGLGGGSKYDPTSGTVTAPTYTVAGGTQNNVGAALDALDKANTKANTGLADAIGGGAKVAPDGTVTAPTITVGGKAFTNLTDAVQAAGAGSKLTTAATGSGKAIGTSIAAVGAGDTTTLTAGNNIVATQNGRDVTLALNSDLTGLNSVAVTGGPTISTAGITGLAAGNIAAGSTDAVNGGQIYALANALGTPVGPGGAVTAPTYTINGNTYGNVGSALNEVNNALTGGGIKYFHANSTMSDSAPVGANSVAIGPVAGSAGTASITIGMNTSAAGDNSIAQGNSASASGNNSIAIGTGNKVSGNNSGAFGDPNVVTGNDAYALGNNNTVAADKAFALGNNITIAAGQTGSVGIGDGSTVSAANKGTYTLVGGTAAATAPTAVVSVGATGSERQVTNVAAGVVSATSTDAINGSQLFLAETATKNTGSSIATLIGGGTKLAPDGTVQTAPTFVLRGSTYNDVGTALTALASGGTGPVQYADAATPTTPNGGNPSQNLTLVGKTTAPVSLTNLAAGAVKAGSTDAVNGSQLFAVQTAADGALQRTGGTMSGAINMGGNAITNLAAPVNAGDAANKGYVDSKAGLTDELGKSAATALGAGSTYDPVTGKLSAPSYTVGGKAYSNTGAAIAATNALAVQYVADAGGAPTNAVKLTGNGNGQTVALTNVGPGAVTATSTDAVNGGQLFAVRSLAANSLQYDRNADGSTNFGSASLGGGVAGATTVLHGLAQGIAPTDAVNVQQLNNAFSQLSFDLKDVSRKAYAGTAAAIALQAPALFEPGAVSMRGGLGYYRGEFAMGLSVRATSDNGRWSLTGGVSGGKHGGVAASAGVDFVLGH